MVIIQAKSHTRAIIWYYIQAKKESCLTKYFKRNEESLYEVFFLKKELLSYSLQLRNKQLKIFNFSLHPEILHASAVRWYMCYWTNFDMGMNLSGDKFELIRSLSSLTCKRSIWEIFQIKKRNCTFLNQLHLFSTVYINEVKLTPSYIQ